MEHVKKARVFRNGRSQAVRIPAEFRFTSDEVYPRKNARTGELTLSERPLTPSLDTIFAGLDAARAIEFELQRDPAPPTDRDWV